MNKAHVEMIISELKKTGTFLPDSKAYNEELKQLEKDGLITVLWPQFDEPPFSVEATALFNQMKRLGRI